MGIRKQTDFSERPNWIAENDFTTDGRIDTLEMIMAFSARDWSEDSELWAMYCVVFADDADDAWDMWKTYCQQ